MSAVKRLFALAGVLGTMSIGLLGISAGVVETAMASGGGGCGGTGGGGGTPGPTQVFASHFSGLSATASTTTVSGTIETDMFVDAFQGMTVLAATGPTQIPAAFVGISVIDTSTRTPLIESFGCVPSPDLQIDQGLSAASLAPTSVPMFDFISNTTSTAMVSADWTGVGDVFRTTQTSDFHSGGFTTIFDRVSFSRNANASGSVSDAGLNVSFSGAASQAELDKVNDGGVAVCVGGGC